MYENLNSSFISSFSYVSFNTITASSTCPTLYKLQHRIIATYLSNYCKSNVNNKNLPKSDNMIVNNILIIFSITPGVG